MKNVCPNQLTTTPRQTWDEQKLDIQSMDIVYTTELWSWLDYLT